MEVVVFGTPNCSFCVSAKQYLEEKGVDYTYKDILTDEAAYEECLTYGSFRTVPRIVIDGGVVGGYKELTMYGL